MLNCNKYLPVFNEVFQHGFLINFGGVVLTKFENGSRRIDISAPGLFSPGTGHHPFDIFSLKAINGPLAAWQVTLFGFVFGSKIWPNLNEDGTIAGPDYRRYYWYFSCLNHKDKILEEIVD